jgi:hypothetical protein
MDEIIATVINVPRKDSSGRGRNATESKAFDVLILASTN